MRKSQAIADVIVSIPLIKKDGTQAIALALTTLSTKIIGPDGLAVTGYTEATFTEPNGDGVYVCKFPSTAAIKAFTLADQANPYQLTLDSSAIDVEPTTVPVWTVSKYPWELASQSTADSILTESQSHPTLTEIEASTVLAKEANIENHVTASLNVYDPLTRAEATADKDAVIAGITALQADLGDPSVDATTIYTQLLAIKNYVDILETALASHESNRAAMGIALVAEHDATQAAIAALMTGSGANQVILKTQITDLIPILEATVQVFNSNQTVLITFGLTNSLGEKAFALDNGTYKIRISKAGYSFTVPETIVVSGNGTFKFTGLAVGNLRDL